MKNSMQLNWLHFLVFYEFYEYVMSACQSIHLAILQGAFELCNAMEVQEVRWLRFTHFQLSAC